MKPNFWPCAPRRLDGALMQLEQQLASTKAEQLLQEGQLRYNMRTLQVPLI